MATQFPPRFIGRIKLTPPKCNGRAYIHEAGLRGAYEGQTPSSLQHIILNAAEFVRQVTSTEPNTSFLNKFAYFFTFPWGLNGQKKIDLVGYRDIKEWPGNPSVSVWNYKNGIFVKASPDEDELCGDATIVLGREEEFRRTINTLKGFMTTAPKIRGLNLIVDDFRKK